MTSHSEPDDLDQLFTRLEREPAPANLTERVLARTVDRPRPALAWPWMVACAAALVSLSAAGYMVGASLAASDGIDLLEALSGDLEVLTTSPGDLLAALAEVVPWPLVGLAGISAVILVWAAGRAMPSRRTARA